MEFMGLLSVEGLQLWEILRKKMWLESCHRKNILITPQRLERMGRQEASMALFQGPDITKTWTVLSDRQRWQFKYWLCLVMTYVNFLRGPQECLDTYTHVTSVHIWRCVLHMRSMNKERISFPFLYMHTKPLSFKVDLNKLYFLQYTLHGHYHWRYRWFIFSFILLQYFCYFFFNWKWTAFSLTDESWIFLVMEKISRK